MKRHSFHRWWVPCVLLVIWLRMTAAAPRSPGYLAVVGPAPLCFARPPLPLPSHFVLPPPDLEFPPAPTPPVPKADKTVKPLPPVETPSSFSPSSSNSPSLNMAVSNGTPAPAIPQDPYAAPETVVSPQMLMRFFSHSTNGIDGSATVPMEFDPPRAAAPAQSSATFTTSP